MTSKIYLPDVGPHALLRNGLTNSLVSVFCPVLLLEKLLLIPLIVGLITKRSFWVNLRSLGWYELWLRNVNMDFLTDRALIQTV